MILCSCTQGGSAPEINAAVDSNAEVRLGDMNVGCHITYVNEGMASMTISSPDTLSGLRFSRADGKNSMSLGSLLCRSEKSMPVSSSLPQQVFSALDTVRSSDMKLLEEKDGEYTFSGVGSGTDITVVTDSTGKPLRLENEQLRIVFSQ